MKYSGRLWSNLCKQINKNKQINFIIADYAIEAFQDQWKQTVKQHRVVKNPNRSEAGQAPVVQKVENTIQWINCYPADTGKC